MTEKPHTDADGAAPGARLALALDMDGLALMARTPEGWARRSEISLNAPDFAARMAALRDAALALDAAGKVELWLPAEQVLILHAAPELPGPDAFRRALADATPHPLDELTWDAAPVRGGYAVAATWRRTVAEAREFAEKWGLEPGRVTTRAADADFPDGPEFRPIPPARRRLAPPRWALGAGAASLAAAAAAVWLWPAAPEAPPLPAPAPAALTAQAPEGGPEIRPSADLPPDAPGDGGTGMETRAPAVEGGPATPPAGGPPRAGEATEVGGGGETDRAPRAAASDAPPGHGAAPGAATAPAPDRMAGLLAPPEPEREAEAPPPTAAMIRPLSAAAPEDAPPPTPAPAARPEAPARVSALPEDPGALADRAPPPEVMSSEFAPPDAPADAAADPEALADATEAEDAADAPETPAPETAVAAPDAPADSEGSAAPETAAIPPEYLAGPDTPRPAPKPGADVEAATAGAEAGADAGAGDGSDAAARPDGAEDVAEGGAAPAPPPPQRPEVVAADAGPTGSAAEIDPEGAATEADRPSAHALAAAPRPLPKPVSSKDLAEREDLAPTDLAVAAAPAPDAKPGGRALREGMQAVARAKARDAARAAGGTAADAARNAPIPTTASVAAAATVRDAANLDDTVLVAVFGAPASRGAILRLPNGDIRRVRNGEAVEGWTVAAIGQSSVRLTRSGASRTLNIPGE